MKIKKKIKYLFKRNRTEKIRKRDEELASKIKELANRIQELSAQLEDELVRLEANGGDEARIKELRRLLDYDKTT